MTIQAIEEMLEASRKDFAEAVASIPPALATTRPAPESWSALECAEHVAIVEERYLGRLNEAAPLTESQLAARREAELGARMLDRSVRATAPETARPTGRFATTADALDAFHRARARTLEFVRRRHADLYGLALEHARLGKMNGTEYTIIVAAHARRHAAQIREIGQALARDAR